MTEAKEGSDLAADAEILWLSQQLAAQDDPHDRALALCCLEELAREAPPIVARRAAGVLAASFGIDPRELPPRLPAARR
ncbi:hypothetical protein [Marinimicrococcus flavescens]|uniref:Uncharacterized protein n=1 Tax=Marinimicrococcus flavescens TaxID=3031815 RepID=A0AAP3XPD9_9PROT|nr:hypothetical protein [Marinimicrococcus flavescens]